MWQVNWKYYEPNKATSLSRSLFAWRGWNISPGRLGSIPIYSMPCSLGVNRPLPWLPAVLLADLGACPAHASYRTQFFRFRIHFLQKAPESEADAPLMGRRPTTGNRGSATEYPYVTMSLSSSLLPV